MSMAGVQRAGASVPTPEQPRMPISPVGQCRKLCVCVGGVDLGIEMSVPPSRNTNMTMEYLFGTSQERPEGARRTIKEKLWFADPEQKFGLRFIIIIFSICQTGKLTL